MKQIDKVRNVAKVRTAKHNFDKRSFKSKETADQIFKLGQELAMVRKSIKELSRFQVTIELKLDELQENWSKEIDQCLKAGTIYDSIQKNALRFVNMQAEEKENKRPKS